MLLIPLGITMIDWATFVATCQKFEEKSPIRMLDEVSISTESPAAFLAARSPNHTALESLRNAYKEKHTDLIHLIFMTESNDNLEHYWSSSTRIIQTNRGELTFLSGTLTQFIDAIIACSSRKHPLLPSLNAIYVYLERGGFRECFNDYTKEAQADGTFILRHR